MSFSEKFPFNKYGYSLIKIIIGCLVVYYLITNLNLISIYNSALTADINLIILSFLLLPVNIYLQYMKWKLSCNYFLNFNEEGRIWSSLFAGFSASIFTPARIGEYFGRGVELEEQNKLNIVAAVFYDKMFTLLWVYAVGLISYLSFLELWLNSIYIFLSVFLLAGLLLTLIIYNPIRNVINGYFKKFKVIRELLDSIESVRLPDKLYSGRMVIISFFFYCCYLIQFVLLLSAFTTGNAGNIKFFLLAGLIMFTKAMVPNFITGELGIRESAAVFFLSAAGEDPSAGFNASIFIFLINIVIPSALGIIPLFRNRP